MVLSEIDHCRSLKNTACGNYNSWSSCDIPPCRQANSARSATLGLQRGSQGNRCLGGEQQECERLLQVESHRSIRVVQITDGDVLANVQVEIAPTGSYHKGSLDRGCPDDFVVDEPQTAQASGDSIRILSYITR